MKRTGFGLALIGAASIAHAQVDFSHELFSIGDLGSAVNAMPDQGGVFNGGSGTNIFVANSAALGLTTADNLDALDRGDVFITTSGVVQYPFLFSPDNPAAGQPGTPIRANFPITGADIYALQSGVGGHVMAYNETDMGMFASPDEAIDAITDPSAMLGQRIYFSLEQGSPTLGINGWSGADILTVVVGSPGTLQRAIAAADMGLLPSDDLDAFAMFGRMDFNGNDVFDHPNDSALLYFSVSRLSMGVAGSDVRDRALNSAFHGSDIFMSGGAGDNTLLHDGDRRIRFAPGDVLNALKLGSGDPADPFPMYVPGLPDPTLEPEKPVNCPPYRGGGVPIGTLWIEVCDSPVPSVVNWQIEVKMCDANGNTMSVVKQGRVKGAASADPHVKAQMIKDAFESVMLEKPNAMPPVSIPVFVGFAKNVPPVVVPRPGISGEVCMFVNQDVIDCGWNVDCVRFSFSNWTANIIVKPVKGWFPDALRRLSLSVEGIHEQDIDGVFRITATDTSGPAGSSDAFAVPVLPGQSGLGAVLELSALINDLGGDSSVDADGVMTLRSLPVEPPPSSEGLSGPLVYEAGALGLSDLRVTVGAYLDRGPNSPCSIADLAEGYGELDFLDISNFLQFYTNKDPRGDLYYDGEFDFLDISEFIAAYTAGCPGGEFKK